MTDEAVGGGGPRVRPPACKVCDCQTGGGEYCYRHAPYMVWPQADGSFLVDRNGRKHVELEEPPSLAAELADLRGERDQLQRQLDGYQAREAACCPEDVGFEEVIASLQKKLATWRGWAQFVYLGGGWVMLPDDALRAAVNQQHDDERQFLKADVDKLRADLDTERELTAIINARAAEFLQAKQDLAALRSRGLALVQQLQALPRHRITQHLDITGYVVQKHELVDAKEVEACADALTAAQIEAEPEP